jgi:hypothetical protein
MREEYRCTVREWARSRYLALATARVIKTPGQAEAERTFAATFLRTDMLGIPHEWAR